METNLPIIAGFVSTALFTLGTLPMLVKAARTRDLASYSLGNLILSNVGNVIYAIYVFQLPPGPIWFLHSFHLLSSGLMLIWYLRYEGLPHQLLPFGRSTTIRFLSPPCCSPTR